MPSQEKPQALVKSQAVLRLYKFLLDSQIKKKFSVSGETDYKEKADVSRWKRIWKWKAMI